MKLASIAFTAAIAAIAGYGGARLSEYPVAPALAQAQQFGHIQVESLTLVGNGRVRGGMHLDAAGNAVFQLRDPTGNFNGISMIVGANGSLRLLDANNQPLRLGGPGNLSPLYLETASDGSAGKGDGASLGDVNTLRDELNALWRNVEQLRVRVNVLSN